MFKAFAKVTSGVDKTGEVAKLLKGLTGMQVYVGIPQGSDNDRAASVGNVENTSNITNAELLYIHTHGIRAKPMRDEMNPKVESGEMPYSKAFQLWIHSHGSPLWQSPPRPVIEPAIEHNKEAVAAQLSKVATAALDGQDPMQELQKAGILGQGLARGWFTNPANGWAPNAPSTIDKKGSDKPLIDTDELRKSITYVVKEGD